MNYSEKIIGEIEMHSVEGIRECFENGVDPNDLFNGKPLIDELTSEYARTPRFRDCVRLFIDYGLEFEDRALLAVLSDDAVSLEKHLKNMPQLVQKQYDLRCAYTPLEGASLLHICAEFNHVASAEVLIKYGADIEAKAGTDEFGFGGQTPVFHTVNQNSNHSKDMLDLLLSQSADLGLTVRGLIWGKSYPWETLIPAVNPISYAMMGLLPQMHRNERSVAANVRKLLHQQFGIDYPERNIPNRYLNGGR